MKTEPLPSEEQLEHLLGTVPPECEPATNRLASAPWTPRAASRRRAGWIVTTGLVALVALFFASPPGRAWAGNLLHYFTRADTSTLPVTWTQEPQSWVNVTPGVASPTLTPRPTMAAFTAQCGDFPEAHCSVEQVRSLVSFAVTELGSIPPGLYFTGATGGPGSVMLRYNNPENTESVTLFESPWTGSPEQTSWQVGPDAQVMTVDIDGIAGEYVSGSFLSKNGAAAKWDPTFDVQTLHWVKDDVFIEMQYYGAGGKVGLSGMIDLAASQTAQPVSALLPPMPATPTSMVVDYSETYPLSVAQAEQQAGFKVRLPARMPAALMTEPVGATYGIWYEPYHVVTMFFPVNPDAFGDPHGSDGLVLHEELLSDPAGLALCPFKGGTSAEVDADHGQTGSIVGGGIETVQIGKVEGQFVIGVWTGQNNDGTWFWDNTFGWPMQLRWQSNGLAYELTYYGPELEKADLIAIAESIK